MITTSAAQLFEGINVVHDGLYFFLRGMEFALGYLIIYLGTAEYRNKYSKIEDQILKMKRESKK